MAQLHEFVLEQSFITGACLVSFLMAEKGLSLKGLTHLLHSCMWLSVYPEDASCAGG